ncbi:MAG: bifunctional (p)ppGpp synthetase/guanosine-3',5'-bis(diphosphate) 3'-pyrophosphohydrolase [Anaerolineae bacterium]|nr:bifunctional (p)ppGpp synthetase/guanosine-3',5'-bis(diphosphate) 3'-pyrophosphohydrolase [Anaerolineae bacterium]
MNLRTLLNSFPDITPSDQSLIERAYRKAETAHAGQFRRSGEPYFTHCVAVAQILVDMKLDAEAVAAALMHDLLEDTNVTLEEIRAEFGPGVAMMVDGVTKLKNLPSKAHYTDNGKRSRDNHRELEYIRKMFLAMGDDVRVVLVKLADRLHNMRTLGFMSPDKQVAIAQETMDIFAPLANRLGIWQIKWELEDLSFRYLQPDAYRQIARNIDEQRGDRETYVQTITKVLREELAKHAIKDVVITGRPKHIYSIYSKMARKKLPFDQIYDVRAVRVIVDTIPQCYLVLGLVHNLWRPIPGEFDDYIAAPKDNFYQSLHTSVLDSKGKTLEVQIRTWEMHESAEYGIAAHWRYKEGKQKLHDADFERRLNYLRRLMEFRHDVTDDAETFVNTMKSEVFQDRVYAFTPKGDIYDLPVGSTPIDFAYHIHTEIGHRCRGARVHGRLVGLNYNLKTGDQVEIITSKRGGPSLDWLNPNLGYVKTTRARAKIRYWFRRQNREKHIASGRELLERELKRMGVIDTMTFDSVASLFNYDRLDDFLAVVGSGDINSSQIAKHVLDFERRAGQLKEQAKDQEIKPRPASSSLNITDDNGIHITGMGGMLTNLARCCHPMQGDEIIGYITRGRGVTVHRRDCKNVIGMEDERLIDVTWESVADEQRYAIPIEIIAFDREGLMRDISTVIAEEKVNMTSLNVATNQNIATLQMTLEIAGVDQLTRILSRIDGIDDVVESRRRNMS